MNCWDCSNVLLEKYTLPATTYYRCNNNCFYMYSVDNVIEYFNVYYNNLIIEASLNFKTNDYFDCFISVKTLGNKVFSFYHPPELLSKKDINKNIPILLGKINKMMVMV